MSNHAIEEFRLVSNPRSIFHDMAVVVATYIAAIAGAEVVGGLVGAVPGVLCHAILIVLLFNHYVPASTAVSRRALPALALIPLLRLLSLTMVVGEIPRLYWYALVGTPLLFATILTIHRLKLSWTKLGLHVRSWPTQLLIALSGLPLSLVAYYILFPRPLIYMSLFTWRDTMIAIVFLVVFTGFTEELIFRGILRQITNELFGRTGLLWSSALFAVMYMGSLSVSYTLFIGVVGLFFSWCVNRTDSIWGVILAHSLTSIGMLIVWPLVDTWLDHQLIWRMTNTMQLGLWLLIAIGLGLFTLMILRQLSRVIRRLSTSTR